MNDIPDKVGSVSVRVSGQDAAGRKESERRDVRIRLAMSVSL
jgi:hypothetical protein